MPDNKANLEKRVSCWDGLAIFSGFVVAFSVGLEAAAIYGIPLAGLGEKDATVLANAAVAIFVAIEVFAGVMSSRNSKKLARLADKELEDVKLERAKLEASLRPREITQEQWDLIQGLSEHFDWINIVCETDAETKFLVKSLSDAFSTAGIGLAWHGLEPGLHSVGILVYEPRGFDGAHPRTVRPLVDMLQKSAATTPVHVVTDMPAYAALPIATEIAETGRGTLDAPAIIVGGRFILPPSYWPPSNPQASGA